MEVIEHLVEEHRKVEDLLQQLSDSEPGDERRRLLEELTSSLRVHMEVEERFVYPLVVEVMGGDEEFEGLVEHDLTRDGLARLQELADLPGFGAAVEMVTAGIGHHVDEEENEVFPALRSSAAEALAELPEPEQLEAEVS